jgi:hypothetical protein
MSTSSRSQIIKFSVFVLSLFFLFSCNEQEKKSTAVSTDTTVAKKVEPPKPPPVAANKTYNDIALLLAGIRQGDSGEFSELEKNATWKKYASLADSNWHKLNVSRKAKMVKWATKEVAELNQAGGTVFYPFSGPDFLNVFTFLPGADTYVMIALEPAGSMPDLGKIPKDSLAKYFRTISRSMNSVMRFSFFRTNSMAVDLKGKESDEIDGALPVILIFMARTGNKIIDYRKVEMDTTGTLHEVENYGNSKVQGCKVVFQPDSSDEQKTLYYFSMDLGDIGLNKTPYVLTYLKELDFRTTYLKSASYLMHKDYFSKIRKQILTGTTFLLQDDSGIPLRFFTPENWDLTFYGTYDKPIPLFENWFQKDLAEAFKDSVRVRPLPFGIGYDWQEKTSNLMLAKKKQK